jgi:hypothetical protein
MGDKPMSPYPWWASPLGWSFRRPISTAVGDDGVLVADPFRLGCSALPQEDCEHGEGSHGEEFGLPVLQRAVPELGRAEVVAPADRILATSTPKLEGTRREILVRRRS